MAHPGLQRQCEWRGLERRNRRHGRIKERSGAGRGGAGRCSTGVGAGVRGALPSLPYTLRPTSLPGVAASQSGVRLSVRRSGAKRGERRAVQRGRRREGSGSVSAAARSHAWPRGVPWGNGTGGKICDPLAPSSKQPLCMFHRGEHPLSSSISTAPTAHASSAGHEANDDDA